MKLYPDDFRFNWPKKSMTDELIQIIGGWIDRYGGNKKDVFHMIKLAIDDEKVLRYIGLID